VHRLRPGYRGDGDHPMDAVAVSWTMASEGDGSVRVWHLAESFLSELRQAAKRGRHSTPAKDYRRRCDVRSVRGRGSRSCSRTST